MIHGWGYRWFSMIFVKNTLLKVPWLRMSFHDVVHVWSNWVSLRDRINSSGDFAWFLREFRANQKPWFWAVISKLAWFSKENLKQINKYLEINKITNKPSTEVNLNLQYLPSFLLSDNLKRRHSFLSKWRLTVLKSRKYSSEKPEFATSAYIFIVILAWFLGKMSVNFGFNFQKIQREIMRSLGKHAWIFYFLINYNLQTRHQKCFWLANQPYCYSPQ